MVSSLWSRNKVTEHGIASHNITQEGGGVKKKHKKPKTNPQASKTTLTIFWDAEGCLLVGFLPHGETINAAVAFRYSRSFVMHCVTMSREQKDHHKTGKCRDPHCSSLWGQDSKKQLATSSPSTPQSGSISLRIPFGFKKDQMRGRYYVTNKAVQKAVHCCLQTAEMTIYHTKDL